MRFVPVPAEAVWPGAERRVMAAPNGSLTDDDIRPLEVIVDRAPDLDGETFTALVQLEPGDLEKLERGAFVAFTTYSLLPPIQVDLHGPFTEAAPTDDPPG